MILQKSFKYADLLLNKYFLLLSSSILKTVVLFNIFVETVILFQDSVMNRNNSIIYIHLLYNTFIYSHV